MTPEEQRDRLLEAITDWHKCFEHFAPGEEDSALLEVYFDICQEVEDAE